MLFLEFGKLGSQLERVPSAAHLITAEAPVQVAEILLRVATRHTWQHVIQSNKNLRQALGTAAPWGDTHPAMRKASTWEAAEGY